MPFSLQKKLEVFEEYLPRAEICIEQRLTQKSVA